jgi:type II secretory pathway pseudopilin PulG
VQRAGAVSGGFTSLELLIGIMLMGIAIATTSGMFVAAKRQMTRQQGELEATQAARAAIDGIVRDLRLGGACLPIVGDFISLSGVDNGQQDEITTRTGLTRPDLTCVSSVVPNGSQVTKSGSTVPVVSSDGFKTGMRAYIRHPNGTGEYFDITAVPSATQLTKSATLTQDYPQTSGVFAVDERRFFLATTSTSRGPQTELRIQIGTAAPIAFATGIENLDVRYQLEDGTVVGLPTSTQWSVVDALLLSLTARSSQPDPSGAYYRRTMTVTVKPRNLLPR